MMAGLMGVPLGSALAQRLRTIDSTCDPLICAFGLLTSAPFVYLALVLAQYSAGWCYFCIFAAEITLNLSWSIVADMLLVSCRLYIEKSMAYIFIAIKSIYLIMRVAQCTEKKEKIVKSGL